MRLKLQLAVIVLSLCVLPFAAQALADESDNAPVIPFGAYVHSIGFARATDYVARFGPSSVASGSDFDQMRDYLLKTTAGEHVAHSFAWTKYQVFDCVPVLEQPAARLPGLKSIPYPKFPKGRRPQSWSSKDAHGNIQQCEPGTVAILRTTLEQLARAGSMERYFEKTPGEAGPPPPLGDNSCMSTKKGGYYCHLYAHAFQSVSNSGMQASIELFDPAVSPSNLQAFSLAQIWVTGGGAAGGQGMLQTTELGYMVEPSGNSQGVQAIPYPQLFVFWTADDYAHTGCYDTSVCCFNYDLTTKTCNNAGGIIVQSTSGPGIGAALKCYDKHTGAKITNDLDEAIYNNIGDTEAGPIGYYFSASAPSAPKCESVANDMVVTGYFPIALFGDGQLSQNATEMDFGGETASPTNVSNPVAAPMMDGRLEGGSASTAAGPTFGTPNIPFNYDFQQLNSRPCYLATTPTNMNQTFGNGTSVHISSFQFGGSGGSLIPINVDGTKFICQR